MKNDIVTFKEFTEEKKSINERTQDVEKGCLMAYFEKDNWKELCSRIIDSEDLHEYGIEKDCHVTVLYEFDLEATDPNDVITFLEDLSPEPIEVKLGEMSIFENEKFDVVKFGIESEALNKMNKKFTDNFEYENDYPEYHPHMTVAYVKPGRGKKYVGTTLEVNGELIANKFVYSTAGNSEKKYEYTVGQENV